MNENYDVQYEDYYFLQTSFLTAINNLRPNAKFSVIEGDLSTLDWEDTEQTRPTDDEINLELKRCQEEFKNKKYQFFRKREYPPVEDYLDAVVKNDSRQMQDYIDRCNAVKLKYPKGR